jgi:hypothetical protein
MVTTSGSDSSVGSALGWRDVVLRAMGLGSQDSATTVTVETGGAAKVIVLVPAAGTVIVFVTGAGTSILLQITVLPRGETRASLSAAMAARENLEGSITVVTVWGGALTKEGGGRMVWVAVAVAVTVPSISTSSPGTSTQRASPTTASVHW